jgi:cytochrome P450
MNIEPINQLTYEHLTELNIRETVVQEILRLHPPATFIVRECTHEHIVSSEGHRQLTIPVEATVVVDIYELHRRASLWHRPLEFDYTRWIRDPIIGLKPKPSHPFFYFPFGAEPRNCIGQNCALLETKVILAMLVQCGQFELEIGPKIIPESMMVMRSQYGLKAKSATLTKNI